MGLRERITRRPETSGQALGGPNAGLPDSAAQPALKAVFDRFAADLHRHLTQPQDRPSPR